MGKELPWYKCKPSERIKGSIQACGYEAKGLFSDICDMYWLRQCNMSISELRNRWSRHDLIDELINFDVIKVRGMRARIEFLDEQFVGASLTSEKNTNKAKKAAEARWNKPKEVVGGKTKVNKKATATPGTDFFYVGLTRIMMKPSEYLDQEHAEKIDVWCMQNKIKKKDYYEAYDKKYLGQVMSGEVHVVNAFKLIARGSASKENNSPYTEDQIIKAKAFKDSNGYLPEWFDAKYIHLLK